MGTKQSKYRRNECLDDYYSHSSSPYSNHGEQLYDDMLAEDLQLQEVLSISIKSKISSNRSLCEVCHENYAVIDDDELHHLELGQASNPQTMCCSICTESKPLYKFTEINPCCHKFCLSCVSSYISAKLDSNVSVINCPEPGCRNKVLDPQKLQPLLPLNIFERWCDALCESMIKVKFYCPYKDCSGLLEFGDGYDDDDELMTESECAHCRRLFCAQCKVPWHDGFSCRQFQNLDKNERGTEDLLLWNLATKLKWQRCPKCKTMVERIDGCKFIKCRCGHCFCYICASPMSSEDHYCYTCSA